MSPALGLVAVTENTYSAGGSVAEGDQIRNSVPDGGVEGSCRRGGDGEYGSFPRPPRRGRADVVDEESG